MGLLGRIGRYIFGGVVTIGEIVLNGIRGLFGFKRKPPTEKIKAELRKQWLEVGENQQIPGVEYEGEIYYDTPH